LLLLLPLLLNQLALHPARIAIGAAVHQTLLANPIHDQRVGRRKVSDRLKRTLSVVKQQRSGCPDM
jgi:hypothetical protein